MEGIEGGTSSGYVPKSVRDQYVEGIDHFPSKCQSLNYNNWWCAYICQWWETPSACLIPRPQRTSLTHVWVVVFNLIFFRWKYYASHASLWSPTSTTAVFLRLQFDGPSTSRAFDDETVSVDTKMPQVGYLLLKMWNGLDASAVYLFYTNRPNYHQYTLLQVATGTQIPAVKSEVSNSSHYYHYLHTSCSQAHFLYHRMFKLCTNGNFCWV